MEVSPRARLAWANRNIEAAADIIVADYLRSLAKGEDLVFDSQDLNTLASLLDPEEVQS